MTAAHLSYAIAPQPWMDQSLCSQTNADLFFPTKDLDGISAFKAKALCRRCAVMDECLAYALTFPALEGIWGATSQAERRELRKRRQTYAADARKGESND